MLTRLRRPSPGQGQRHDAQISNPSCWHSRNQLKKIEICTVDGWTVPSETETLLFQLPWDHVQRPMAFMELTVSAECTTPYSVQWT